MLGKAAEDLRERLCQHAIDYIADGKIYTRDYGKWVCRSYSENSNVVTFFGLSTGEAAELIRTFDTMQMAKKHPWRKRGEVSE